MAVLTIVVVTTFVKGRFPSWTVGDCSGLLVVVGTIILVRTSYRVATTGEGVPSRIRSPVSQTSRFEADATPERELYLLIRHIGGMLIKELAAGLEPLGITPEQYHILRILRDAGPDGLPCSTVAERAVSGDPDVTRLLDRLERQQWAIRTRDTADRRVVTARITTEGKRLLARLENTIAELHAHQFNDLGARELSTLRGLLERVAPRRSDQASRK